MRFLIKDEIKGRIRFNLGRSSLTYREADIFRDRMMKVEGAEDAHPPSRSNSPSPVASAIPPRSPPISIADSRQKTLPQ